ncbi:SufD family Fe-S cluster assembly protein [Candidatus Peribacteria bacterium]|nr:MAG: SufD family Fe-S cluster assembly protein [Candidatus Peribacteria bacterium]
MSIPSLSSADISIPAGATETKDVTFSDAVAPLRVTVGQDATFTLLIRLTASAKQMSHDIDVSVAAGARCTIITVNTARDGVIDINQGGVVADGGVLRWQNITLGNAVTVHNLRSRVEGAHGESAIDWMFYAKGSEKQQINCRNVFDGREGSGEILMRGVAEEKGHAVAKGMIEIGLGGGGTNTYLTQEVLMLDSSAKVDAVPGLEIKTNDVKASHSATVTRLTPEDLFYFASRGVPKAEARAMYIQGFLGAITDRITDEKVKEEILGLIAEKYAA